MNFDKSPKKEPKTPQENNNPPPTNFQLPSTHLNVPIPKNNVGTSQSPIIPPAGYNRNDGTFSPIPPNFRYVISLPSHYSQVNFDWGEPSFDVDDSEDSIPQKIPMKNENVHGPINVVTSKSNQKVYNSLEDAFNDWMNGLKIKKGTKKSYSCRMVKFLKILDSQGITSPPQNLIDSYRNAHLSKEHYSALSSFNATLKQFFRWMNGITVYHRKTDSDNNTTEQITTNSKNFSSTTKENAIDNKLLDLSNKWSKALTVGPTAKIYYKIYILNFIVYLTKISSFSPTIENIKAYFKSHPELLSPSTFDECKDAIKSFLQFMESKGIVQDHTVYEFLDSYKPM